MKQIALDDSLNELSADALIVQIGCAELRNCGIAASFAFVCINLRKFGWAWLRSGFISDRVTSTVG